MGKLESSLIFFFVFRRINGWDTNSWKLLWLSGLGHVSAEVSSTYICSFRLPFRSIFCGVWDESEEVADFFPLICLDVLENDL